MNILSLCEYMLPKNEHILDTNEHILDTNEHTMKADNPDVDDVDDVVPALPRAKRREPCEPYVAFSINLLWNPFVKAVYGNTVLSFTRFTRHLISLITLITLITFSRGWQRGHLFPSPSQYLYFFAFSFFATAVDFK